MKLWKLFTDVQTKVICLSAKLNDDPKLLRIILICMYNLNMHIDTSTRKR